MPSSTRSAGTAEAWAGAALRILSTAQDLAAAVAAELQGTSAQLTSRWALRAAFLELCVRQS